MTKRQRWLWLALFGAGLTICGLLTLLLGGLIALVGWLWTVRGYAMLVAAIAFGYGVVMVLIAANRASEAKARADGMDSSLLDGLLAREQPDRATDPADLLL